MNNIDKCYSLTQCPVIVRVAFATKNCRPLTSDTYVGNLYEVGGAAISNIWSLDTTDNAETACYAELQTIQALQTPQTIQTLQELKRPWTLQTLQILADTKNTAESTDTTYTCSHHRHCRNFKHWRHNRLATFAKSSRLLPLASSSDSPADSPRC